ncbi:hypothetical protein PtrSN002B_011041 [Pyrenophora tritici-repentis]|uniref:Nop14 multi-domain protein n=1 Tax=Pyrenophora tritici-repentis TaxID=45151 RepID=A0A2W1EH27_9PLEO|nr:hypothetical protein PtrV1_13376 [Pyrenophora tritici-repentis]KAF7446673.1 hypothetical protein A1F99_081200 [Pyrenophora tritici-repentis]KAF7568942.1 Nop14 multi-domain protein [Pyrenophora tritici-repentis]KAG9375727.1 hypothetical protein A1F94_013676 [Pyrenophora tritici-repentis]KAI0571421.1 hypothetical protein Alg130_10892 [Pyrenophora tritici-repentis]
MRLRLTVQRNGLPAANVLWNVPETNSTQAYTITRLLEDVNLIIPLEAEHWGLEHYVVEVAGFECLHFMPVINALKEDDHVSIRPLMTAEVRARTLTGRHQISDGGQHLVDGVPFGRPYLRQPNRPAVRIPPRKRRRLEDREAEEATEAINLLTENGEVSEEDEVMPPLNGHSVSRSKAKESHKAAKSVQFAHPEMDASDDSDEDDDDFAPGETNEEEAASEEDSDDTDSDSDAKSGATSSASDSSGSDSSSDSDSGDSDSDSDAASPPDVLSSKDGNEAEAPTTQPPKHTPPGQGLTATQIRNARRTRVNHLRRLKGLGELPENATLNDLRDYEARKQGQPEEEPRQTEPFSTSQGKRKRLDEDEPVEDGATELERRKRELMAKLRESPDITAPAEKPAEPSTPVIERAEEEPPTKKQTPQRRLRPDTGAIGRILARQAAPFVRKGKAKAVEEPPEPEGASEPDFWKSRINLSAFECWEEDYDLSAPPFPFQQHWDPASKLMRDKASKKKNKKRGHVLQETVLKVDEEEEDDVKMVLNYDDAPATIPSSENTDAAIEDQLRNDVATAAQADLPPLPEDMQTLPDLASSDVKVGAIIACKFFTVNPITITPEISDYKTATVEHEGDSGPGAGTIQLRIAARDLPKREIKFDSKGNRIYNAADALLMEEDDEDEGLWEGMFGELLEAKLLKAA